MFTKPELKSFRVDFESAVKDLEKKYGVKIALGNISYSENEFHSKMTCNKVGASGKVEEPVQSAKEFGWLKEYLGFKGNVGDTYVSGGKIHTVYALDGKKPKYPVLTRTPDGMKYKTSVTSANLSLSFAKGK